MEIYRFDRRAARSIESFGSIGLYMAPVARLASESQIGCMHLAAGGSVGYHQATVPQLFLVVQGAGWVRGEADERVPIAAGQAAFWQAGEWHAVGSEAGMVAVVIESQALEPEKWKVSR